MGAFLIQPLAKTVSSRSGKWGTNTGTPDYSDTAVLSGITTTDIGAGPLIGGVVDFPADVPASGGSGQVRFTISSTDNIISLDGGASTNLAGLPGGFTLLSAKLIITVLLGFESGSPDNGTRLFVQQALGDESECAQSVDIVDKEFNYAVVSNMSTLLSGGFGVRSLFTTSLGNVYVCNARITGTYTTAGVNWYYNAVTDHYQYSTDPC